MDVGRSGEVPRVVRRVWGGGWTTLNLWWLFTLFCKMQLNNCRTTWFLVLKRYPLNQHLMIPGAGSMNILQIMVLMEFRAETWKIRPTTSNNRKLSRCFLFFLTPRVLNRPFWSLQSLCWQCHVLSSPPIEKVWNGLFCKVTIYQQVILGSRRNARTSHTRLCVANVAP